MSNEGTDSYDLAAFDEAVERATRVLTNTKLLRTSAAEQAMAVVRALLSDSVPCPECGGTQPCRASLAAGVWCSVCCDHGQVSQPSLAILRADLDAALNEVAP